MTGKRSIAFVAVAFALPFVAQIARPDEQAPRAAVAAAPGEPLAVAETGQPAAIPALKAEVQTAKRAPRPRKPRRRKAPTRAAAAPRAAPAAAPPRAVSVPSSPTRAAPAPRPAPAPVAPAPRPAPAPAPVAPAPRPAPAAPAPRPAPAAPAQDFDDSGGFDSSGRR